MKYFHKSNRSKTLGLVLNFPFRGSILHYLEDAGQEVSQEGSELVSKCDGEVDEQHEVAVANVGRVCLVL